MNLKKYIAVIIFMLAGVSLVQAERVFKASAFGIESNGTTMNTTAIQEALNYISRTGGGTLQFYVGRYLTGTIELKSNVKIVLNEGAILVGSTNIYDYNYLRVDNPAFIYAEKAENISIEGKGVIDGRGRDVVQTLITQIYNGFINDPLKYDRPAKRPKGIYLRKCKNVNIKGITVTNAAEWTTVYDQCDQVIIDSITILGNDFWNNDGIDIVDCTNFKLLNSYISAADDAICFKSHDPSKIGENIEVRNCVARSGASGIKFGTVTRGGYKNIKIINNKVYNTLRSALTIQTPDGGNIENILVDSLYAYHVGNPIFLRIGNRWADDKPGYLKDVVISNMYCEVTAVKPDAGYTYEGPEEENPRNISPSSIMGLPGFLVENITLKNVEISYPGGGNPNYAFAGTTAKDLAAIPELESKYPEFSQWKELPAWGFFIRHAKGITFDNVRLIVREKDYRPSIVLDDVEGHKFSRLQIIEEGARKNKKQIISHNSK